MVRRVLNSAPIEEQDIFVIARPERQLRRQEVERITGLSCSTIYRLLEAGDFPRPLRITTRCVRWLESEIAEWQASRGRTRAQSVGYQ
jgi:prophage regulatory protein